MNRIHKRSLLVFIITLLFIVGLCFFTVRLVMNAQDWSEQSYNGHISGSSGLEKAGKVLDRNGFVLAQTVDGERLYNEDEDIRRAMLHVVGDNSLNISTAVQSTHRTELIGYSYILGLSPPKTFKTSRDIKLTLDNETCKTAYQALGGREGAIVVYNYKTGEVICLVSAKTYDPQDPPEITEENEDEYEGVYLNRVLSSTYTPGSIFKVVTAACALGNMDDVMDRTFYCSGSTTIGGSVLNCMDVHGEIDLADGLARSCNVVFGELAAELGEEKMTKTANMLGFNKSFEIDETPTVKSRYDLSKADEISLAWSGVGQYTDLANPMHMAIMMGAVANGGEPVMPYMIDSISQAIGFPEVRGKTQTGERMIAQGLADSLGELLRHNVTSYYGDDMFPSLSVCAKTGSAETNEEGDSHAWMIGYSQDEDAPLAFAVVVENAGLGFAEAGPVASTVMEACAEVVRKSARD